MAPKQKSKKKSSNRKASGTQQKRKSNSNVVAIQEGSRLLSEEEWNSFTHRLCSFSINVLPALADSESESDASSRMITMTFKVGDDVIVDSRDGQANLWIAKIIGIRSNGGSETPFVKYQWYHSGEDLAPETRGKITRRMLAPRERMMADTFSCQSYGVINRAVHIFAFNDNDLNLPDISEEDFFVRHSVTLDGSCKFTPTLDTSMCALCNERYIPFTPPFEPGPSAAPVSNSGPTHFCPRPSCRRWYHQSCLIRTGRYMEPSMNPPPTIQILAVDPDLDAPFRHFEPFTHQIPATSLPVMQSGIQAPQSPPTNGPWSPLLDILYSALPKALVRAAQEPIIRCPNTGTASISGNIKEVVAARRTIYAYLENQNAAILDEVKGDFIALEIYNDAQDDIVEPSRLREVLDGIPTRRDDLRKTKKIRMYGKQPEEIRIPSPNEQLWENALMTMSTARFLASPVPQYWNMKETQPEEPKDPTCLFSCPKCLGVI